jgi:hypothetical protein
MFRRITPFVLIALMLGMSALSSPATAQTTDSEVSVSVTPENPGPNQSVTISLQSFTIDLDTAEIEWSIDGKGLVRGIGYKRYTFTTKSLGAETRVTATITPTGQFPRTKTVIITPMSVDILWQATDSTVPPFYRGKALATSESTVKFVAIPQVQSVNGALIGTNQFLYTWRENFTSDQNRSGYGKNAISYSMDYLNPTKHVTVAISSLDGATSTAAEIDLTPDTQKLVWYESSPKYGPLYATALTGEHTVSGSDISLLVEPYFFSPGDRTSQEITYEWRLNGEPITPPRGAPNTLFLHRDTDSTGDASLALSVSNTSTLFQEARAQLLLHLQ